MNKIIIIIILCIPTIAFGQIDWGKITNDFNNELRQISNDRNARRQYYENLTIRTKNSILTNTHLTSDNYLNNVILELQNNAIDCINTHNNLFKRGLIKESRFEPEIKQIHSYFINTHQSLSNLIQYKNNKIKSLSNQDLISEFEEKYRSSLRSIEKFSFRTDKYSAYFHLDHYKFLSDDMHKVKYLYNYIQTSCE